MQDLNTPESFFFSVRENVRSGAEKMVAEVIEMPVLFLDN